MSDWISVKDRLPEPETYVLVHSYGGRYDVLRLLEDSKRGWYPGGLGLGWTTHWMPLPAPPEAK